MFVQLQGAPFPNSLALLPLIGLGPWEYLVLFLDKVATICGLAMSATIVHISL